MLGKRIIPCLDVKDGRVVKGVNFANLADVNSPVELAKYYSANGADELVFYDITASSEGRGIFTDILKETAAQVFIPQKYGIKRNFIGTAVLLGIYLYGYRRNRTRADATYC